MMSQVSTATTSQRRKLHARAQITEPARTPVEVTRYALQVFPRPDRHEMIAEAAYHRAEARGFAPGHELEDWLAAEVEVDARIIGERAT